MSNQGTMAASTKEETLLSAVEGATNSKVSAPELLAMLERCDRLLATIQSTSGNYASRCIQIDRDSIRALIQRGKE